MPVLVHLNLEMFLFFPFISQILPKFPMEALEFFLSPHLEIVT